MKKMYLLFFMLLLVSIPFSDAMGQYLYYQGSYDHDSSSRSYIGYKHSSGSHLYGKHHYRFGYIGSSTQPGYNAQYYNKPYTGYKDPYSYRGPYYIRKRIVEEHYYGYPNYPYAPSPRQKFRPFYNVK